jgi:hypothetical protein
MSGHSRANGRDARRAGKIAAIRRSRFGQSQTYSTSRRAAVGSFAT